MNDYADFIDAEMCDCCGEEFPSSKLADMESGDQYCRSCMQDLADYD